MTEAANNNAQATINAARAGKVAGNVEAAREYMGDLLWARLWRAVTALSNCKPELATLIYHQAEIKTCMKIAQDMQVDLARAEEALEKIRKMFTKQVSI